MYVEKTNKIYEGITPSEVWNVWKDVSSWPNWNTDIEFCQIHGPFEKGTTIELKPKKIPQVKLSLEDVLENRFFIDSLPLPGAKMLYKHEVIAVENGVELITMVSLEGSNSQMWLPLIGENVVANMITQMDAVASIILRSK